MHERGHSRLSLLKHENFIAFTLKFPANAYHNPFNKEQKNWRRFKLCRHKRTLMLPENQTAPKVSCQKEKCYVIKKSKQRSKRNVVCCVKDEENRRLLAIMMLR